MVKIKELVKRLEIIIVLLVVIIVALAFYIIYPSIQLSVNGQPFGKRLTGINAPLSGSQLAIINNAPNNNYEIAGMKLLNLSIPGVQNQNNSYAGPLFELSLAHPYQFNALIINNKPSVVYIGATSCIYCGENRWAMALALSRFGSFKNIYIGYSSLGDGDIPTLYWVPQDTTNKTIKYGNNYQSSYINFFSAEYDSPITAGFQFPAAQDPIAYFITNATNSSYRSAMQFMDNTHAFQGTPFTFWGSSINAGADAVVFSNGTTSTAIQNTPPLTYMSHAQIFAQLNNFNSTFAYEEYAAADVYIAEVCPSINNAASICSLPAIRTMESKMGLV